MLVKFKKFLTSFYPVMLSYRFKIFSIFKIDETVLFVFMEDMLGKIICQ